MTTNHTLATDELDPEDFHALVVYEAARILQTLAWEEVHRNNRQPEEFIVFCLEGNSSWRRLIEGVEERSDWKKVQSPKSSPVFYGVATETFFANFEKMLPETTEVILNTPLSPGFVKALVCTRTRVEIMQVKPSNFGHLL